MAYVPDPTDVTQPTDAIIAETAQAEFRALKAYIQSVLPFGAGGLNFFRRNLLINAAMLIDQRNAGAAIALAGAGKWVVDKFAGYAPPLATVTGQQTAYLNGMQFDYNITVAHAPAAGDGSWIETIVEGYDAAFLGYGTALAKVLSLSFIVSSPVIGSHCVAIRNSVTNRSYVTTYNIPVINTPTYISINNIPGDIAGAWNSTTGVGLDLIFDVGSGTTYETLNANVWQAGNFTRITGSVIPVQSVGHFQLTQVQLEQAAAASQFEQINIGDTIARCMRYYWKSFAPAIAPATNTGSRLGALVLPNAVQDITAHFAASFSLPRQMRTAPTITLFNPNAANALARAIISNLDAATTAIIAATTSQDRFTISMTLPNTSPPNVADQWLVHATANADFF